MQNNKYSVEETKYIKMGLYTIAGLFAAMALFFAPEDNKKVGNQSGYELFARFNRTDGLFVGDDVRMAGVNIGKVVETNLDENFKSILTLDIADGIKIPNDSSASIVSASLIGGGKYIEIDAGGMDEYFEPNAEFEYTQDAMVLEELLQRIIDLGKANRKEENNE